ncbi:dihydrolipoyl dehydrogenase [Clostridiisalibacter paucivorans]|uniref:dihydrolipoyl dehydrogenase n=1 Tax=Clostridiisalibacter paucivorans TaxID=408753 RepID=UPI000685FDD6|nr:dihydrolipoyl dehydrogenase [Clostridiisalibacter paucivorans]
MNIEVKLDKLSGHAKSGEIGKVYKDKGSNVKLGDELFDIESNKGNITITSDITGKILDIHVNVGDKVSIGDILLTVEGEKESNEEIAAKKVKSTGFNYMGGLLKPKKEEISADITIIGGGPGGYVAAIEGAKLGAKIVLIEKESMGGTCLNWGCIPTKALVRSAEIFNLMKESKDYGVIGENISLDMKRVIDRKKDIINELVQGIEYLMGKNKISVLKGNGEVIDKNTVFVKNGNKETTIKTKNMILATGSKPAILPIEGNDAKNVLTSKELMSIDYVPDSLIIVGGGVIGMEFAFIFNAFGSKVTVIEYARDVLAVLDKDVREEINKIAKERGITIYTSSKVNEIIDAEDGRSLVKFEKDGIDKYITGDKILMSVGRQPYYGELDLQDIAVQLNENGKGIKVDDKMETTCEGIYAIGDVTNKIQLAHVASHQGIVAVNNIMGKNAKMDYTIIPSAIFTSPEIATVGLCEREAKDNGIEISIGKFPFGANGKALTLGEKSGFVKIIADKSSQVVLGGAIIGPHATDLIHEITLAIKNKLKLEDIIETIHAHPTTAEAIHEASLAATNHGSLHF